MSVETHQRDLGRPAGYQSSPLASAAPDNEAAGSASSPTADSSAAKALSLINAFGGARSVLGVTELARQAGLPKSTAHRLLSVLMQHQFVRRVGERYCLSEHVFELGNFVLMCRPNGLRQRATPYLAELFAHTRQTIHLAVLRDTDVLYVDKLFGHDAAKCDTAVGARKPAYATALGKAMLAYSPDTLVDRNMTADFKRFTPWTITGGAQLEHALDRVRSTGWAIDHEEYRRGVTCLAAAIRDPQTGNAIAGLSICSTSSHDLERKFSRLLMNVVNEMSQSHVGNML
jgi:DNA-binding IclR family transcriptional regulator